MELRCGTYEVQVLDNFQTQADMAKSKWSKLDGNGSVVWADAHLTETGIRQAWKLNRYWAAQIEDQKIPAPYSYYTSPLARCLETAMGTFAGQMLPPNHMFVPTIKEVSFESRPRELLSIGTDIVVVATRRKWSTHL